MSSMDDSMARSDNHSDNDSGMDANHDNSPGVDSNASPYCAQRVSKEEYNRQTQATQQAVHELVQSQEYQMWFNKCSSCHVSWYEGKFTYGCEECGGFALKRPCPICNGKCQAIWRRDTDMCHKMISAYWDGDCKLPEGEKEVYYLRTFVESSEDVLTDAMNDLCGS